MKKLTFSTMSGIVVTILLICLFSPTIANAVHVLCEDGYCKGECECTGDLVNPEGRCAFICYVMFGDKTYCGPDSQPETCNEPEI